MLVQICQTGFVVTVFCRMVISEVTIENAHADRKIPEHSLHSSSNRMSQRPLCTFEVGTDNIDFFFLSKYERNFMLQKLLNTKFPLPSCEDSFSPWLNLGTQTEYLILSRLHLLSPCGTVPAAAYYLSKKWAHSHRNHVQSISREVNVCVTHSVFSKFKWNMVQENYFSILVTFTEHGRISPVFCLFRISCLSVFYLNEQIQFVSVFFNSVIYALARMLSRPLLYLISIQCLMYEDSVLCLKGREKHTSRRQNVVWVDTPAGPTGTSHSYCYQVVHEPSDSWTESLHYLTYKHMQDNSKKLLHASRSDFCEWQGQCNTGELFNSLLNKGRS